MLSQATEHLKPPERAWKDHSFRTPGFRLLVARAARHVYVTACHPLTGNLVLQPHKLNTPLTNLLEEDYLEFQKITKRITK